MIRKVKLSLKYKFVIVITFLLLCTMGFYLSYALNIFKEDKSADIYSITLNNSISVSERVRLIISEEQKIFDLIEKENEITNNALKNIILNHDEINALECVARDQSYQSALNENKYLSDGINFELNENSGSLSLLKSFSQSQLKIELSPITGLPPHFGLYKKLKSNSVCAVHFGFDKLMTLMNETLSYGTYIVTDKGKLFLKLSDFKIPSDLTKIASDKNISNLNQGVKRFNDNGEPVMRAFVKIPKLNLIAITEIPESKAFMASNLLIQKSFFYGLLILSIAVIAGILFTKRMTKNLQTLFEATVELSKGNFSVAPVVVGHDEIGALSDSFIDMKDKIILYMEEMKEKVRIESEVKVAKLVQDSFFPKHPVESFFCDFTGHYEPASECSGDWWGHLEQENKLTIITCDATGHGVPAALITAAAYSSLTTLKMESAKEYISPKMILDRLNKVVSSMHSNILMTAFVLEIDLINKKIKYANASHMAPYLLRPINNEYTKDGLVVLNENNGPRVGEKLASKYFESELEILENDKIVLFSDGILEALHEGKAYGQRNFLKNLFKNSNQSSSGMVKDIVSDFKAYCAGEALADDITLICVSIKNDSIVLKDKNDLLNFESIDLRKNIIYSELSNEENVELVLGKFKTNHLIGMNGLNQSNEILLINKFENNADNNLINIFADHFAYKKIKLETNKAISSTIEELITSFKEQFIGSIKEDSIRFISDELLTNAFYHSKESPVSRGDEIILLPNESVEIEVLVDELYLVVAVKGPSRFKSNDQLIQSLKRGYLEKRPQNNGEGAGLGLYLCFDRVSQFWVVDNQVICILEKFNRNKTYQERITSFHYIERKL